MILDNNAETDYSKLWALIVDLNESLRENEQLAVTMYTKAANVRRQAIHSQVGFVLRRFNKDKTQEEYDAELERMNAAFVAENQALQHDNKQLNSLIKEYEQTLESVMSAFRNRAQDVQERELSLIRDCETKLLSREEGHATQELMVSTAISASLARLSTVLRKLLRVESGEDEERPASRTDEEEEQEPWNAGVAADYSMEREVELARLQAENDELRRMLELLPRKLPQSRLQGDYRPTLNLSRDGKYVPYRGVVKK